MIAHDEAAAASCLDEVDLRAERLEHPRRGVARVREEVVDDARREERNARLRARWVRLRDLARAVVERLIGDGGEALLAAQRRHRQAHQRSALQRALKM